MATERAAGRSGASDSRFARGIGSGIIGAAVHLERRVLGSHDTPLDLLALRRESTHAGG